MPFVEGEKHLLARAALLLHTQRIPNSILEAIFETFVSQDGLFLSLCVPDLSKRRAPKESTRMRNFFVLSY